MTTSQESSETPAGWYPNGDVMQWWDGTDWSDQTRPLPDAETWRPGWYPKGNVTGWWDGLEWTEQTRPLLQVPTQQASTPRSGV